LPDQAADQVYRGIIGMISRGDFRPGERLPAARIAELMGVSRTPVREALKRLADRGVVTLVPNVGARLAAPSRGEVENAYEVRACLEAMAARRAATHATAVDLARLEECVASEKEGTASPEPEELFDRGLAFHRLLAQASGNPVLLETLETVFARTSAYDLLYPMEDEEEWQQSRAEHADILEALKQRDPNLAERLVREHVALGRPEVREKGVG
jgi:DNA-binding GntR family transcriptional regulator